MSKPVNNTFKSFSPSNIKISADDVKKNKEALFSEYPAFSFKCVTSNKDYNFGYFGNNKREELEARKALDKLLEDLSKNCWLMIIQRRKAGFGGYETLPYQNLKFQPKEFEISYDEKVSSIRFGKQDAYRLIGKWRRPVFYIFGYDFDYDAYDHGS